MPTHPHLSEGVETYLRTRKAKGRADTTVANDTFVLSRFLAWYGDGQLRHMNPEKVADFFYGEGGACGRHETRDGVVRDPIKPRRTTTTARACGRCSRSLPKGAGPGWTSSARSRSSGSRSG